MMPNVDASALAALGGSLIGGLTSFATTWAVQRSASAERKAADDRTKRETHYGEFIGLASRIYGDALGHEKDDVADLVDLYDVLNRLRLFAPEGVIDLAELAVEGIVEAYLAPNLTLHEMRTSAHQGRMDPLKVFAEACRGDLANRGVRR